METIGAPQPTSQAQDLAREAGLSLEVRDGCLCLTDGDMEVHGDLSHLLPRVSKGRLAGELLVKAARIRKVEGVLRVVDATAGLGDDSFLLAAAGFEVTLFEHNPVVATLLADSLWRACGDSRLAEIASRMTLVEGDSVRALEELSDQPDVIYLDPMFPGRQKSAAVKKKLQLLQRLEMPCASEEDLVKAAIAAGPRKIVVKRPLKGPTLAGMRPSYSLRGKAIRFDCLVLPRK